MFARLLSIFFASTLLVFSANAQKESKTPKEELCSVSGMVVKMAGSAPLRKAHLLLESQEDKTRRLAAVTNADGRFTIKGIEPGSYRLMVSRLGFVTEEYGQRKPDAPGANLTLRPGQEVKDLLFRLVPSAVITGKILDEDGEPLPSVSVNAQQQSYSEGKRKLSSVGRAETNDLGEYRLYGLSPGRYFVSAVYPRWGRVSEDGETSNTETPNASSGHEQGYATMYYPGTAEVAKAEFSWSKPARMSSSRM